MEIKTVKSIKELLLYLSALLAMFFCAYARISNGTLGFALGLYVALVYCRSNMIFLAPCYIAINLLCDSSLTGIIYAISPIIVMSLARFAHYKAGKPIRVLSANLYGLISLIPTIFCDMYRDNWGNFLISLIANQIFCSLSIIICFSLLVRRNSHQLSIDEIASGFVVLAIISLGAYSINLYSFRPYFLILGIVTIYSLYYLDFDKAIIICLAVATGACLAEKSLAVAGGVILTFLVGSTFSKLNIWFCGISCILTNCLCGIYFDCFAGYNIIHIATFASGILILCVIPKKNRDMLPFYKFNSSTQSVSKLCDNIKKDMSNKINNVSQAFYQMADAFCSCNQRNITTSPSTTLAQELVTRTCNKCPDYQQCFRAYGKPMYLLFESMFATTCSTKTLVDLPNFCNTRCSFIPELLSSINRLVYQYNNSIKSRKSQSNEQALLASQFAGIGNILNNLCNDLHSNKIADTKLKERIISELGYNNIVCYDIAICYKNNACELIMVVRKEDEHKKALIQLISKILQTNLVCAYEKTSTIDNRVQLVLRNRPRYDITFACASISKTPNVSNGDTMQQQRISYDKAMISLCDGMGNGENAHQQSSHTLNLISKLYCSDIDRNNAIAMVNRLLAFNNTDNFSALDLCLIDLNAGICDFIKMGGVESLIKRESSIETVYPQALPIGIIEDARPQIQQKLLEVGDIVTMCSDGIMDSLTCDGVRAILSKISTINPQQICDEIVRHSQIRGLNDDASIIAFRIFEN